MNRFEKRLLAGLGLLILLLAGLEAMAPKPQDWSRTYSRRHRTPYGARLVYERLGDLFPERTVVEQPLAATHALRMNALPGEPVNHVFVNDHLGLDRYNTRHLLEMVAAGDHALLAAHWFSHELADTLKLGVDRSWDMRMDTSDIRFIGEPRMAEGVFRYARGFPGACFSRYDTARARVVAVDGAARPVLLHMAWGEGRLVLCTAPLAFTNYNLLKDRNAVFAAAALSLLPPRAVWWDEYQKTARAESQSLFRFIKKQPPLAWAFYLAWLLLGLFLLTRVRRQQRAIPVLEPPRNASRELARTIGRLYWQQGDHAGIARKMIAHFKEEARARAYLRAFAYDAETIGHLAVKTGLEPAELDRRLKAIARAEAADRLTEQQLIELSNQLHDLRQRLP